MSAGNDLIERAEKEAGCRFDEKEMHNSAMDIILGAMSRELGNSPKSYGPNQDAAAGIVIRHRMTPEYKRQEESKRMLAKLLVGGMDPSTAKDLMG